MNGSSVSDLCRPRGQPQENPNAIAKSAAGRFRPRCLTVY